MTGAARDHAARKLADDVVQSFSNCTDERLRSLMQGLVRHLHARPVNLSNATSDSACHSSGFGISPLVEMICPQTHRNFAIARTLPLGPGAVRDGRSVPGLVVAPRANSLGSERLAVTRRPAGLQLGRRGASTPTAHHEPNQDGDRCRHNDRAADEVAAALHITRRK